MRNARHRYIYNTLWHIKNDTRRAESCIRRLALGDIRASFEVWMDRFKTDRCWTWRYSQK